MIRVSDRNIQSAYLTSLAKSKADLATIQKQMVTQSKINKPSDSPLAATRIIRMSAQIENLDTYSTNIDAGVAYIDNSSLALEGINDEMQYILAEITDLTDATVSDNLGTYADKIKASLGTILDLANTSYDGQFLLGGSDVTTTPYGYNGLGTFIEYKSTNLDAENKIKISNYTEQKINMNGKDIFAPVIKQKGNFDSTSAVGSSETTSQTVYNAEGLAYTVNSTYTKTAANTYSYDYEVLDPDSNVVTTHSSTLVFNASTGKLETIDGSEPTDFYVSDETNKLNFMVDVNSLTETSNAANITSSISQKGDVFNTLASIAENLANGTLPTQEQIDILNDFDKNLINKISELGSYRNRLTDTQELNQNQSLTLQELVSKEKDVDVAQLIIDLQEKQYNLDLTYKISATLLPKSLLDYI